MQVTVKALQGRECSLQVPEDERVSTLKHLVSEKLNVPVVQQRLLFKGKALADELRLSDYSIGPNSKINLVIKLPDEGTARHLPSKPQAQSQPLPTWLLVSQILARHFSTADTRRVLEQLQKDYDRSLRLLSLDDIERLATRMLNCTVTEPVEVGFLD
ncbi:ubiquitin-like protein 4A [Vombatus ursinus]|uniref:Ubiquitin-like protein 4A n=1 Tax=Vombatus ursinus TaxID=29139 RepID=A0A4X2LI15_VOMUR|nr:ubiquitin-like protein 4A [Vombatus ursinus]